MPPTQAQLDEVRSYIQRQAAEKSIEQLVASVRDGVAGLTAAANGFSEDALARISAGEEWTPLQCLSHIVESNIRNGQQVLYVALSGELPPDEPVVLPANRDQLLGSHHEAMESLYIHVLEADPEAFLDVRWTHQFFGALNWREWFIFLRVHCLDHTRQLQAMLGA